MKLRQFLQYFLPALIAVGLLYYAFKDIAWTDITEKFYQADYRWIILATLFFIISNISRAYRWLLLLRPLGYFPTLGKSFLAVMVGYFINLIFPRAGEVSRSAFIQRMAGVSAPTALGTIILERIIDVLMLLSIMFVAILGEYKRLEPLLLNNFLQKIQKLSSFSVIFLVVIGLVISLLSIYFIHRNATLFKTNSILGKIWTLFAKLAKGITSIRRVENPVAFVFHTLLIWFMYFCMSYSLFFCFANTANLGIWVGFVVLVVGAMGMAAPVQGGTGAYHILVSAAFVMYGLTQKEGLIMATFMHTAQTLVTMLTGGACFAISLFISHKKQPNPRVQTQTEVPNVQPIE
ncbi:MAG: flippase-like domain-containing protein [Microscillaceae bacterium]|nr:flippase-like domain-containing protein [Microscillaceae bacterium]MDW8459580.1 lysylphosphatidylglycerol synthase transmembrane domain-containing protein [Cytophagales bacterium]